MLPLLVLLLAPLSQALLCSQYDACNAALTRYTQHEGSGYEPGSGEAPPLYDELIPGTEIDYDAPIDISNHSLCECPDNSTCSAESESLVIDPQIRLTFCKPIEEAVPSMCKRSGRNNVRVMASGVPGSSSFEVQRAIVFCRCTLGYKRQPAEPWEGALLIPFKCL